MNQVKTVVDLFDQLPDPRRGAGQRHNKTFILLLVLMSTMSGLSGYRAIGDFIQANRTALLRHFKPHKNRLPTFDTVRRLLIAVDFDQFCDVFYQWAKGRAHIKPGEWMALDGKAIGGSLTGLRAAHQRFIMLVSLYCSRTGLSLALSKVDNSKQSEGAVIRQLIEALDIKGVVFTLDALHCQKKH
jgi:hypothetical protein